MVKNCCVYQCRTTGRNLRRPDRRISLHSFPKRDRSPARYRQWVNRVSRKDFVPTSTSVVCSEHFTEEDFTLTSRMQMRLMPDSGSVKAVLNDMAVPSLGLRGQLDKGPSRRLSKYLENKARRELLEEILRPEVVLVTPNLWHHPSPMTVLDAHGHCDTGTETLGLRGRPDEDTRRRKSTYCENKARCELFEETMRPEVVLITPNLSHPPSPTTVLDAHAQCDMGAETLTNARQAKQTRSHRQCRHAQEEVSRHESQRPRLPT